MTLARLPLESVRVRATERSRLSHVRLARASVGLLPPLCALALLPATLRAGVAAILCGAARLLCGPVLLGRLLDAPPTGRSRRSLGNAPGCTGGQIMSQQPQNAPGRARTYKHVLTELGNVALGDARAPVGRAGRGQGTRRPAAEHVSSIPQAPAFPGSWRARGSRWRVLQAALACAF